MMKCMKESESCICIWILYLYGFIVGVSASKNLKTLATAHLQCHPTIAAVEGLADQTASGPVWSGTQHRCRLKLTTAIAQLQMGYRIICHQVPGGMCIQVCHGRILGYWPTWGYVDQIIGMWYIIAYEPMRRVRSEWPWIWSLLVINSWWRKCVVYLDWIFKTSTEIGWLHKTRFFSGFHGFIVF